MVWCGDVGEKVWRVTEWGRANPFTTHHLTSHNSSLMIFDVLRRFLNRFSQILIPGERIVRFRRGDFEASQNPQRNRYCVGGLQWAIFWGTTFPNSSLLGTLREILRHHKTPNAIGIALGVYNGPFFWAQLSQIPPFWGL